MSGLSDLGVQDDPVRLLPRTARRVPRVARGRRRPLRHRRSRGSPSGAHGRRHVLQPARRARRAGRRGGRRVPSACWPSAGWARAATLQRTDPPVHTRYRKLLNRVFTPGTGPRADAAHRRDRHGLIDRFADQGTCEFVSEFALPMPGILIAEQLGLDQSRVPDVPAVGRRHARAGPADDDRRGGGRGGRGRARGAALPGRRVRAPARRARATTSSRCSSTPTATTRSRSRSTSSRTSCTSSITGGFETTTGGAGHGHVLLVRASRPAPTAPGRSRAHEELHRGDACASTARCRACGGRRRARSDVGGVDDPRGRGGDGALRRRQPRPGGVRRAGPVRHHPGRRPNHVAFGFGNHYCVGAALARQEMLTLVHDPARAPRRHRARRAACPTPAHEPSFFLRPGRRPPAPRASPPRDVRSRARARRSRATVPSSARSPAATSRPRSGTGSRSRSSRPTPPRATQVTVDVRGREVTAIVTKLPFVRR